jgi:hypothetical protein
MTKEFTLPSVAGLYRDPVFEYWYTTDEATAYSFSTSVTGNLTLHAKWTEPPPADIDGQPGDNILAKALAYIAGQSPANYTIVLDGPYNLPPTIIDKADAVITLVGKTAAEISLSANGSLFTIDAGELVLDNNITLKGRNPNNNSLVRVSGSSSFLRMKAGAFITGNTYVATAQGGGVQVTSSGTFTMSGGTVSNNTASSSPSYVVYGGGVYIASNGTFTMSGGAVTGNTANGGGVAHGGGVFVFNGGTFTMSGGEVSGNTAASSPYYSAGGGVHAAGGGTFTMSGGTVTGNIASSTGSYSMGGGVYANGVFTMSGGAVSNNILLSDTGMVGREVLAEGTFKMSGDARPQRVFLRYNTIYVTIAGPVSGEPVPIDLGISSSNPLTNWLDKPILALDSAYGAGNLADLKTHFTLEHVKQVLSPFTEAVIPPEYTIGNDGRLKNN